MQNIQNNILGFGIDLCDIERINSLLNKHDPDTIEYLFNYDEYLLCINHPNSSYAFAGFFALKEAFSKATGYGMSEMSWKDIEIKFDADGNYLMILKGKALDYIKTMSVTNITNIIQEEKKKFVLATVILNGRGLK